MRVLHLSYDYGLKGTSGAPIAAARLHLALLRAGVDSHFICVRKLEDGPNVTALPRSWIGQKIFYFYPRVGWVLTKLLFGKMLMPNLISLPGFAKTVGNINPDIVHIHLIAQDMVSFEQLEKLDCKFVYTMHDLTCVNAIEPHPCGDRRFAEGFIKQNSSAVERWMFGRKRKFIETVNPVFTGPSDWVCRMFRESLLGKGRKAHVVLNIVDPAFAYDAARLVPHEKFTVLFGAFGGRASPYKGWPDLEAALKMLPNEIRTNTVVNVFGEQSDDCEIDGVQIHFLGPIKNVEVMRGLHHSADVFALPSRQDNAPQVKFESLLDGLPVIAFNRTGCAEFIDHRANGWVAADGDIADYASGLAFFYEKFGNGELSALRQPIADAAKKAFAESEIVSKMLAVYRNATA